MHPTLSCESGDFVPREGKAVDNQRFLFNVRQACKEKGITVSQLESALGWSQGLISRWSKTSPSVDKLIELVNYLGVSYERLLGGGKSDTSESPASSIGQKLAERTRRGKIVWKPCEGDSVAAGLVGMISEGDCLADLAYCTTYEDGYFFLVMAEGDEVYAPRLYLSPDATTPPTYEPCDEKSLSITLEYADPALCDSWRRRKTNQFKERFLAEED